MILTINGEPRDFPDGLTLAALIAQLGMKADRVAVELNLEIVPRGNWEATQLKDGDKLEIVHFVGGGSGRQSALRQRDETQEPGAQSWTCPSCSAAAEGNFCSGCGEKQPSPHDLSVRHLLSHAGEALFHWDSKIFRSFWLLFSRPGFLAAEYVRGARRRYLHPFQLFFIANLLYFILQPFTGWSGLRTPLHVHTQMMPYSSLASRMVAHREAAKGVSAIEFERAFNHVVDVQARSLVILMVPFAALLLAILEWRKRRTYPEHLVFSLHLYAAWLIGIMIVFYGSVYGVLLILAHNGIRLKDTSVDSALFPVAVILIAAFIYPALRRFYQDSAWAAVIKALLLARGMFYILELYRFILFITALYSA